MAWTILILFIIVVLIVWIALLRNVKTYKPDFEVSAHHESHPESEAAKVETEAPAPTRSSPLVKPDDLTIVEGIGPKVSALLKGVGITNLAQLAEADPAEIKKLLGGAGLQFLDPGSWPEQASLAAEGKMAEFEALKERLKGGRKVG